MGNVNNGSLRIAGACAPPPTPFLFSSRMYFLNHACGKCIQVHCTLIFHIDSTVLKDKVGQWVRISFGNIEFRGEAKLAMSKEV